MKRKKATAHLKARSRISSFYSVLPLLNKTDFEKAAPVTERKNGEKKKKG